MYESVNDEVTTVSIFQNFFVCLSQTHTLTRDHGFVPLSDLNLKKLAANDNDKLKSSSKTIRSPNDPYSSSLRNDRNRYLEKRISNRFLAFSNNKILF